ncbi:DUF3263 domain-containing protein [Mycolicibacterium neoaurum]|uniref:DUF3263 domain-containing protein n=1 Tax=Mycolicibacterium neoaurum TaxID=1795 RepID=UPI002671254F|nr:DUF3263 domain-containing protein [Mycolicibacterium neoaurum]MDO3401921.1 DUF3263 domain-containing protein [Mycolicibacterium neoaurum]
MTDQERAILDLEERWWSTAGGKEATISDLRLSPVRYYQLLNLLVDTPSALAYYPLTANRVRRLRERNRSTSSR